MARKATALVISGQGRESGWGASFCIAPGLFVTTDKVANTNEKLSLVLDAGEAEQRVVPAKVIRADAQLGFALLRADVGDSVPALELGASEELVETMNLTAFGFPYQSVPVFNKGDYPSGSVMIGRITSLRKKQGTVERIEVNAAFGAGNFGGAVVNDGGRVVGIVLTGIPMGDSGPIFIAPVAKLKKFLQRPEVAVTAPLIGPEKLHDEQELMVNVMTFQPVAADWTVVLTAGDGAAQSRPLVNKSARFRFVPFAKPHGPKRYRLVFKFPDGVVMGQVDDRTLKFGSEQIPLGRIRRIEKNVDQWTVTLASDKTVTGTLADDKIVVRLGSTEIPLNLSQANSIVVQPVDKPVERIEYIVQIKTGEITVAMFKGSIDVLRFGSALDGSKINQSLSPSNQELPPHDSTIQLPNAVHDIVAGGGGRYLFLLMSPPGKLAVFDAVQRKIVHEMTVDRDACMAAGQSDLLVLTREKKLLERYRIGTWERELAVPISGVKHGAELISIHLGFHSQGPALLMCGQGPRTVDLNTLESTPIPLSNPKSAFVRNDLFVHVRASGDGSTFGGWRDSNTTGFQVLRFTRFTGQSAMDHSSDQSVGAGCPSFDGRYILTGRGRYSTDLQPIGPEELREQSCWPTVHPHFYWASNLGNGLPRRLLNSARPTLSLYDMNGKSPLLAFDLFPEVARHSHTAEHLGVGTLLTLDKRIQFFPEQKLLVTLDESRTQLFLRPLDIKAAYQRAGIDYFYLNAIPRLVATRGQRLSWPIGVESKHGGLEFQVEIGPDGMTISREGQLEWSVPADQPAEHMAVTIKVRNSAGQELQQPVTIMVK